MFWFLSGTHNISSPVIIRDVHNITLEKYGEGQEDPRVEFNASYYTCSADTADGACIESSAVQFYNASRVVVSGLVIAGQRFNQSSAMNGISFEGVHMLTLHNTTILTSQEGVCHEGWPCVLSAMILSQTHDTVIRKLSSFGRVILHQTANTNIQHVAVSNYEIYTNITENTDISDVVLSNSCTHGISSYGSTNMTIQRMRVINTNSHCIRLERMSNTTIADTNITHCGDDGIKLEHSNDVLIKNVNFLNVSCKSLWLTQTVGITVADSVIYHSHCNGIYLVSTQNTSVHNTTLLQSGIYGSYINYTSFSDISVRHASSPIQLFGAVHTNIVNSSLSINNVIDSTSPALSISSSTDTLLEFVSVTASISVNYCNRTTFSHLKLDNVSQSHGVWVYKNVNVSFASSSFVGLGIPVVEVSEHPAVVVLCESSGVEFSRCQFSQNRISALKAVASVFSISNTLSFTNNTALLGAAMVLQQRSAMKLSVNSSILFSGNHATSVGGAIYVDTNTFYKEGIGRASGIDLSSECIIRVEGDAMEDTLVFVNNSAMNGGDVVYGGQLGIASAADGSNCLLQFKKISRIEQLNNLSAITSQPSRVCVCSLTGKPECLTVFDAFPKPVYPGQIIHIPAVVVGQDFSLGTVSGSVYAQFLNRNGEGERDAALKQGQNTQGVSQDQCNQLNYTIFATPATCDTVLVLSAVSMNKITQTVSSRVVTIAKMRYELFQNNDGLFPLDLLEFPVYINITILPCPTGFMLSRPPFQCECNEQLRQLDGVKCDIQSNTFERSGLTWVGGYNTAGVLGSNYCPFLFCKNQRVSVTLDEPDVQCNFNHSGTLCGGCKPGLSLALGSDQCLTCSNHFLALLIPFMLAGIALVFAIKVLDITVSHGFLNSLVFYFNLVHSAHSMFVPQRHTNPLSVLIAWANLDWGIETCFFNGLSAYWKAWLQFVFPLYIWVISALIIISAKYSSRIAKLMGNNSVSVLATLFLLSYTKLLRTTISILSFSVLVYPNGHKLVWSVDGNIDYLGPQHLPLFAVAVVVLLLMCFPYTLLLLLGQWLCKCDNRFVSRMLFRIKPFLDAYYGPLKDNHRYWFGVLLLSRAAVHVTHALIPSNNPSGIIFTVSVTTIVLLQITGFVLGFYRSTRVSAFEVAILSNLALFSLAKLYTSEESDLTQTTTAAAIGYLFISAAVVQLGGIVLVRVFHVMKLLLPDQCNTLAEKWPCNKLVRGMADPEGDWEAYEEAALMRQQLDDGDREGEDMESVPICNHEIPTYGI